MAVKAQPDGYHTATPYLVIDGAAQAIEFYKKAFGATEKFRMGGPNGKVGHAELMIGDSAIMLADEHPEMGARGPKALGGTPVSIVLYFDDVDAIADQAVQAGGKIKQPLENKFYGDRMGTVEDPFGHLWHIATHIEDVSEEEMGRRAQALAQCGEHEKQPAG